MFLLSLFLVINSSNNKILAQEKLLLIERQRKISFFSCFLFQLISFIAPFFNFFFFFSIRGDKKEKNGEYRDETWRHWDKIESEIIYKECSINCRQNKYIFKERLFLILFLTIGVCSYKKIILKWLNNNIKRLVLHQLTTNVFLHKHLLIFVADVIKKLRFLQLSFITKYHIRISFRSTSAITLKLIKSDYFLIPEGPKKRPVFLKFDFFGLKLS